MSKTFSSLAPKADSDEHVVYGRQKHDTGRPLESAGRSIESDRLTLMDQYLALLLAVLTEAGLLDVS